MRINTRLSFSLAIFAALFLVTVLPCAAGNTLLQNSPQAAGTEWPKAFENTIGKSTQILLVENREPGSPGSIDVRITALEKKNGRWRSPFAVVEGVIGRNGFALPGEKREGDGKTPSGAFPLGSVFGYAASFPTRMPYRQATADDLWVDDVNADDYNRWVTRGTTRASSFERMRRDDDLYKLGIVVEYNTDPVVKGLGSAIFLHIWKGKGIPTAGCIALSEDDLARIAAWLDPAATPLVFLTNDAPPEGIER